MDLFGLLLVLHILASIAIIGPAFVMPIIQRSARTVGQLHFTFGISTKLAIMPKIGGFVLVKILSESQEQGNDIPAEFGQLIKKIVPIETAAQLLMIAILVLMVVKPF